MKLKVLIHAEAVGGYSVSVPAFPGCYSEGDSIQEALANIREAAELWLEVASENGIAKATSPEVGAELQEIEL
jgi:predicted RNase H-like HicB family nuclease